jgi:hypothetical protein
VRSREGTQDRQRCVDRLDRQPVLGEEQRVSADAATEIAVRAPLAFNSGKRPSVEPARSFASR